MVLLVPHPTAGRASHRAAIAVAAARDEDLVFSMLLLHLRVGLMCAECVAAERTFRKPSSTLSSESAPMANAFFSVVAQM